MDREYALRVQDGAMGYDGRAVISGVQFDLRPGEILTLIGPNGAGKSTILKSLAGQLPLIAGRVELCDQELRKMPPAQIATRLALLLTQRPGAEMMTCRDMAATGRYPYTGRLGILTRRDRDAVEEAMALTGTAEIGDRPFDSVSDGQRQRVLLARAICQEPSVLILDEPTSYLDIRHKLELIAALKRLVRRRGMAAVMSMHELDLAQKCSDWVLCLRNGRVERAGPPEEIFQGESIARLYDLSAGSYDPLFGSLELPAPDGAPRVFVIGGNGRGIPVYRRLQRQGIPFVTGILWENDVDYAVARALAAEIVALPFGAEVTELALSAAMAWIDRCGAVCWAAEEPQRAAAPAALRRLAEYAQSQVKLHLGLYF